MVFLEVSCVFINNNNNNLNTNTTYRFRRWHYPASLLQPAVRRSIEYKVPCSVKSPQTLRKLPSRQPLCQTRHIGRRASTVCLRLRRMQRRNDKERQRCCLPSTQQKETAAGGRRGREQVGRCGSLFRWPGGGISPRVVVPHTATFASCSIDGGTKR